MESDRETEHLQRITTNPAIFGGQPVFKRTRVTLNWRVTTLGGSSQNLFRPDIPRLQVARFCSALPPVDPTPNACASLLSAPLERRAAGYFSPNY